MLRSLAKKYPDSLPVVLFLGHFAVYSQNFRYAVAEYSRACVVATENKISKSFAFLCLAASSAALAMSRRTTDRHLRVLQGWAAIQRYGAILVERPEQPQLASEIWFNRGRYLHQLGQWTLAVHCYLQALDLSGNTAEGLSLTRTAGYALYTLYVHIGNIHAARHTALKYIPF